MTSDTKLTIIGSGIANKVNVLSESFNPRLTGKTCKAWIFLSEAMGNTGSCTEREDKTLNEKEAKKAGRKFAMSTLVSTLSYPVMLGLIEKAVGDFVMTEDLLLSALFGGLCIGLALAIVIRIGASTGGMDIPPLILQKTLRIPVSASMYVFDFAILIGQMLFTPRQTCLYGILLVLVYTIDPDAFVVMSRATSVHGKGFSKAKEYIVQP